MTERQRQMIEGYLPRARDKSLEFDEYYYLQYTSSGERVIKVHVREILPQKDSIEYGIYNRSGRIGGDPFRGVRKYDLYDNKEDCKEQTHIAYDDWEELRLLQEMEDER